MDGVIKGHGGGKGESSAQRTPVESADTLRSTNYARVIDLLCEGEIEGLVGGLKGIYLDGVPVQREDGGYNFLSVSAYDVKGTQSQEFIPSFPSSESSSSHNLEVTTGTPRIVSVADANIDALDVEIEIPQLTWLNATTDTLEPTSVEIAIDLQTNGGGYVTQDLNGAQVIRGKCTSAYVRTYRVELPGSGPWDVRVRRITANSGGQFTNQTFLKRTTQVVDSRLSYPNSALVALQVSAHQFDSIPTRSYRIKGLKVKVPSNYYPLARHYEGTWDGTFKTEWTDNPAWCFYDLLTSTRYGLGKHVAAANVDKWGLYAIAQYCDAWVASGERHGYVQDDFSGVSVTHIYRDGPGMNYIVRGDGGTWYGSGWRVGMLITGVQGFGNPGNNISNKRVVHLDGALMYFEDTPSIVTEEDAEGVIVENDTGQGTSIHEPRFRCNAVLQTQVDAYEAVNALASVFRGIAYWASGAVYVAQDAPGIAEYLFTAANVVDGTFTYSGTGRRARHNAAIVQWNDPQNHFKATRELVTDETALLTQPWNPTQVTAFGCTSRGQAQRVGRWLLYSERLETEAVTFRTGIEGAFRTPGSLIKIQDQFRAGKRFGGRLADADDLFRPTLDGDVALESGKTYTLSVITPEGAIEERAVSMESAARQNEWGRMVNILNHVDPARWTGSFLTNCGRSNERDPSGGLQAVEFDGSTSVPRPEVFLNAGRMNGSQFVFSIWAKRKAGSGTGKIQLRIYNNTTATYQAIGTEQDVYDDRWTRYTIACPAFTPAHVLIATIFIYGVNAISALGPRVLLWGPQLELAAAATDHMPSGFRSGLLTTTRNPVLSTPLSKAPPAGSIWVLTASDLSPATYRVLSVAEVERGVYEVAALKHESGKYALVEQGIPLQTPTYSQLPSAIAPTGVVLSETLVRRTAGLQVNLQARWNQNTSATSYVVRWRRGDGNWTTENGVQAHFWELRDIPIGTYTVEVAAVVNGFMTAFTQATYNVLGKTALPANVTGFTALLNGNTASLRWNAVADVDLDVYELRYGASWAAGTPIGTFKTTEHEWGPPLTPGSYTVRIKAKDTSGNYSAAEATVVVSTSPTTPSTLTMTVSTTPPP